MVTLVPIVAAACVAAAAYAFGLHWLGALVLFVVLGAALEMWFEQWFITGLARRYCSSQGWGFVRVTTSKNHYLLQVLDEGVVRRLKVRRTKEGLVIVGELRGTNSRNEDATPAA